MRSATRQFWHDGLYQPNVKGSTTHLQGLLGAYGLIADIYRLNHKESTYATHCVGQDRIALFNAKIVALWRDLITTTKEEPQVVRLEEDDL